MPLLPSRTKYRKPHTRGFKRNRVASQGNTVAFGDYGIQVLESGQVTARQIEAARVAASRCLGRVGKMWIRIFPHTSITGRPAETRMGKGKGDVKYWCAQVHAGTVLFELAGVTEDQAREALRLQAHKLPMRCRMVKREDI